MNILVFNLAIDSKDSALSFTTDWLNEIAKKYEKVFVITLRGDMKNISKNVKPFKLYNKGKNKPLAVIRFYYYLFMILFNHKICRCFSHMNPLFLGLTLGILKILKIKTILWYTHPAITLKLRIATFLTDKVVSASQFSFPIKTNKLIPIGHAIDTNLFSKGTFNKNYISCVGRISEVKNIDILLHAFSKLNTTLKLLIIGEPLTKKDEIYKNHLVSLVNKLNIKDRVIFKSSVKREKLEKIYNESIVHINLTSKGFLDKVALEAMSCGTISLSSNVGYSNVYGKYKDLLHFNYRDKVDLTKKISSLIEMDQYKREIIEKLIINNVREFHSLNTIGSRIDKVFNSLK